MRLIVSQQYPGIHTLPVGAELKSRAHCLQGFSEDHRKFRFMPIGALGAFAERQQHCLLRTPKLHMLGEKRLLHSHRA